MQRLVPYLTVLILAISGCIPDEPTYPNWKVYDTSNSPLSTDAVSHVAVDGNDRVWVLPSPNDGTLYLLENEEWSTLALPSSGYYHGIIDLKVDQMNRLWACYTKDSLVMYDGLVWQTITYPDGNLRIQDFDLDPSGGIWLATWFGLVHFDGSNWQRYGIDNSDIPTNELFSVSVDVDQSVWVGSFRDPMSTVGEDGLFHFDGVEWTVFNSSNSGLPNDRIMQIDIGSDGVKWLEPRIGGITRYDGNDWVSFNTQNTPLLNNKFIGQLVSDRDFLWGCTNGGVLKYDDVKWTVYHKGNSGLPTNSVFDVSENSLTDVYFATACGLVKLTQ
jgi:ligand-binding sensor domain-containing protein